jgi:hypothetical protein
MKKYTTALLTLLAIVSFVSCDKKDDDDDQPAKTKTELITTSTWKLSAATANGANAMSFIEACYRDNIGTFVSTSAGAGNGTIVEGATECNPSSATTFTWSFQTNETVLQMSSSFIPIGNGTFNIQSLTETTMVLQQNMTLPVVGVANVVLTFVH